MADLPSILGGMAQGFLDFGKSAVDLFGTGGASIADLIESARTGKVTTKNSDDFRKWLYETDDVKDAAAKGLGTALNGVQTVSDYIPGIGAVTRNPLFNAGQGALGGLADEFKMYGKDYDLGRAGQRAAVGAGGALASTGLADALKGSGNALLKSGTAQGLARGAVGGAIGAGGYTAIDGGSLGDVANSALQGAGMGAALGGTMGALQDFKPARTYDVGLTDDEKAARIANAKNMLANEQNPERIAELNNQINNLGRGLDGAQNYRTFATGDEAREYFSKNNPAYWDGLPSSVDEGIQEYTRNGYSRVNDMLRTGQDNYGYPDTDVLIGDIERGIEGYNLPDDIKVYRRSAADAYKNLGVGDTFTDEGFTSTSISPNIGGDFGKANIEINVGNGKGVGAFIGDLSSGNGDEGEFLLQRGTKYKVLGRGKDGTLQLEVVGNERRPLEQILSASDAAVNNPKLTPEQEAYFKDSVIRDENGNLKKMYHGSPDGTFTKFRDGSYFTDDKDYADTYQDEFASASDVEKAVKNPKTYEVYLDIKKPFSMADPEAQNIIKNEYIKRDKNYWVGPVDDTEVDWTEAENLRKWLKKNYPEYDGLYVDEGGGDSFGFDGDEEWQGNSVVPFSANQIKDINNLTPTDAPSIMESRMTPEELDLARALADQDLAVNGVQASKIAPGQLGLFDDMPTQAPKTGTRQTSLFDQPQEVPAEPVNPYAPVDGKLTQAMKDRYWEVMKNADGFGGAIDNELYNKIDRSTLPKGYDKLQQLLDSQMGEDSKVAVELRKGIGTDMPLNADLDKLVEYVYGDEINGKQTFYKDLDESVRLNKKNAPLIGIDAEQAEVDAKNSARTKLISRAIEKAERKVIDDVVGSGDSDDIMYALQDYRRRGVRTGSPGALDTVLSERLGIAPGNTVKVTDVTKNDHLSSGALGRYARSERNIALSDINSPEGKVSTMAHERLHSFQNESRPESAGRYSPEVAEAYKQLQKDLGHYYKSNSEIKKRYGRNVDYWASSGEQESRMFQQYLENKGYTDDSAWRKMSGKADEWGNEINPAFDKFIDKLRDLSKRGVALPALAALFGGGAYMASQENDKDKEKEVK